MKTHSCRDSPCGQHDETCSEPCSSAQCVFLSWREKKQRGAEEATCFTSTSAASVCLKWKEAPGSGGTGQRQTSHPEKLLQLKRGCFVQYFTHTVHYSYSQTTLHHFFWGGGGNGGGVFRYILGV